jgi:predicted small secreted protein
VKTQTNLNVRTLIVTAALGACILSAATLSGCNTVKGAGEDLKEASDNTKGAINKATK